MKFSIPSYLRPKICYENAYSFLKREGISDDDIQIFVHSYLIKSYADYLPAKCLKALAPHEGITEARKLIREHYQDGERVVSIDDDVNGLLSKRGKKLIKVEGQFKQHCQNGFEFSEHFGTKFWGVTMTENPFYMKSKVRLCSCFCPGPLYGWIQDSSEELIARIPYPLAEDLEFCARHVQKFGAILRFEGITFTKLPFYKTPGGVTEQIGGIEKRKEIEATAFKWLIKEFPGLVIPSNSNMPIKMKRKKSISADYIL